MPFQYSVTVRNAQLDALETAAGASAFLQMRSGAQPADCAAAASGTLIAEMALPADWMNAAAAGSKTKLGTWSAQAVAGGTIAHFRLLNNAKTVCHVQGSVTITGSGGDLTLDNPVVVATQTVVINGFTVNAQNA